MEEFVKGELLKDKGKLVGYRVFLAQQYEDQNIKINPWLDAVLINYYKWLRNPKFIIMEMVLSSIYNDITGSRFEYPVPCIAQVVIPLNGLSHKEFFDKYSEDENFLAKYSKLLEQVIELKKEDIEKFRNKVQGK